MRRSIVVIASLFAMLALAPAAQAEYRLSFSIGRTADPSEYRIFPSVTSDAPAADDATCPVVELRFWTDEQPSLANTDQGWDLMKAHPFRLTKPGLRTVYAQLKDSCGREGFVVPNTIWHGPATPAPTPTVAPRLVSAQVTLPTNSDLRTRVDLTTVEGPNTCTASAFRYANEDGTWKRGLVSRQRPFIVPSPGAGYKGVYTQLVATCDDGTHYSNVVYTRYTMPRLGVVAPKPPTPVLRGVSVPATSSGSSIAVTVSASDDVRITRIRFATEDGNWGPWRAFATPISAPVSAGLGYKGVYVQVGDASGRTSSILYRRFTRVG